MRTVWGEPAARPPRAPLPPEVDVAVIGAGYAGLSIAADLLATAPGLILAVLEAGHVGAGASGRNAGGVMPLTVLPWLLRGGAGRADGARLLRALHDRVAARVTALVRDHPELDVPRATLRMLPTGRVPAAGVEVVTELLERAGIPATLGHVHGSPWRALLVPGWTLHPIRLVDALVDDVVRSGGTVHEHVTVRAVLPRADGAAVVVAGRRAVLRAGHVVVATGGRTSSVSLPDPPRAREVRTFARAGRALRPDQVAALGGPASFTAAVGPGMAYWRLHDGRLVFGGSDLAAAASAPPRRGRDGQARLDRLLARRLPEHTGPPSFRWDGRLHVTPAEVPVIRTSAASPRVHYALGFAGSSGIALTSTCGPWVRDLVLGAGTADPLAAEVRAALTATRVPPAAAVRLLVEGARHVVAVRARA